MRRGPRPLQTLSYLTQRPEPRRRRRDGLAHVDLDADVVRHRPLAVAQRRDEEPVPERLAVLPVVQ